MAGGYGFAGFVGYGKQSAFGTAVAATDYIEALSENVTLSLDRFETKNLVGGFHEPDDQSGVQRISGDITFAGVPDPLGFFLYAATGIQSNSVVLSGVLHTHTFTMATTDDNSRSPNAPFTLEVFRDVTSSQQYQDCNVSQLDLNLAPNQALQVTASIIGRATTNIAKTTPTFTSSPSAPLAFDTVSIAIAGAANVNVEALSVNINNQLEGVPTLQNQTVIRKIRRTGPQMIRLSGTLSFEDITEYQAFRNQTEQQFKINATRADSFSLLVDLPGVVYTAFPLGIGGRGRQTIAFEGRARYDSSSLAIVLQLTNTTSGY